MQCTRTHKKMKNVARSVIERINRDVGADIANLSHCKNITNEYVKRVAEIEAEVNINELLLSRFEIFLLTKTNTSLLIFRIAFD